MLGSNLLDDGENTYYAIALLKMDAKKYVLSTYYWKILWRFISFVIVLIAFRSITCLSIFVSVLYSIFNVMLKTIFNYCRINDYKKNKNTMAKSIWIVAVLCYLLAIVPPIFKYTVPLYVFEIACTIVIPYGIYSFYKLSKFDNYYKMYKDYLNPESKSVENKMKAFNNKVHNQVNVDKTVGDKKSGVKYLNSLFEVRYRKKIYFSMILKTIIILIEYIAMVLYIKDSTLSFYLIYFFVSAGTYGMVSTNANKMSLSWFENCDYAMLRFKSYRTRENIVKLFWERFVFLLKINFWPVLVTSIGATILFKNTEESKDIVNYLLVFGLGIFICINVVLSVLLIYYIIQPNSYNDNMKKTVQDPAHLLISIVHMFLLVIPMVLKLPISVMGAVFVAFTIVHLLVGLGAICKFATKTFRVKNR